MTSSPTHPNDKDKDLTASSSEVEADITRLDADLSRIDDLMSENPALVGGEDLAELLSRLTNADDMAKNVDDKLDKVLSNLDDLLASLGVEDEEEEEAAGEATAQTQPTQVSDPLAPSKN